MRSDRQTDRQTSKHACRLQYSAGRVSVLYFCSRVVSDVTGKYIKEGQEASSSEETQSEDVQSKLWELSGRYTSLDGYEPLEPPPRPVEQDNKQEEKKADVEDDKAAETGEEKKGDEEEKKEEKDADKSAEEKPKIEDCDKSAEETTKAVD